MENVLSKINQLLASGSQMMIKDSKGELHPLQAGLKGELVESNSKDELYQLIWGKKRIGADDITDLYEAVEKVKKFVLENSSYQAKKKLQEVLK